MPSATAVGLSGPGPRLPVASTSSSSSSHLLLPQNIAHRGFRAQCPENSLHGFHAALDQGHAVALETDVHLSRDKVVVLSHDPTLRRCFGRPERIADCDWSPLLEAQRTTQPPHVPLATLADLLALLRETGREDVWVLLDIKRDDDPEELVRRIAETLADVPADWSKRIVLGCWTAVYMRHCQHYLPNFPIAFIGFSLHYAFELLPYDQVQCFNLLQHTLVGPYGERFLREARARGRTVLAWTVNAPEWMDWCIGHRLDGVITDDPALFSDVAKRWGGDDDEGKEKALVKPATPRMGGSSWTGFYIRRWARLYLVVGLLQTLAFALSAAGRLRYGPSKQRIAKELKR